MKEKETISRQEPNAKNKTLTKIRKKFNQGCVDYALLDDEDKILIALSGGKDSLMLVKMMAERARIYKPRIIVEAAHVVMDNIPYESSSSYLKDFCEQEGIKLHILHSQFDESTDTRKTKCFLCAWNRRKTLFSFAVENGFNKVALGHHQDDIIVTWLMNATFEGNTSTMLPSMKMNHYPIKIIRPLCLVQETWIMEASQELGFTKQKKTCPYEEETMRSKMSNIFKQLEEINPEARYSLWKSAGL